MEAFRRLYDDLIGRSGLQTRGMINEADSREIKKGAKNTLFEKPRKKGVEIIKVLEKTVKSGQTRSNPRQVCGIPDARKTSISPNSVKPPQTGQGQGYPTFHEKVEKTKKTRKNRKKGSNPRNWAKKGSNPRNWPIRAKKRPIRANSGNSGKIRANSGRKKTCNQNVDCFQRKTASKKRISTTKA